MLQNFFQPATLAARILPAFLVVVIFAAAARGLGAVSLSGAIAGGVIAFILYVTAGPAAFLVLFCVFILSFVATRLGYDRKLSLGTAERRGGRRASQILANLGIAAGLSGASAVTSPQDMLLLGSVSALAEAAADTVSSEFGQAVTEHAYLVTNLRPVKAGTDGGVSVAGTLAGLAAAIIVAMVAWDLRLIKGDWIMPAVAAAAIGAGIDSFLGATLERRALIGNNSVNLIGTAVAAGAGIVLAML